MRRTEIALAVVLWGCTYGGPTQAQRLPASGDAAAAIAKLEEADRAKTIASLHQLVGRVREQGWASVDESSSFELLIGQVIKNRVLGLTAVERQKLVKNAIGEADYSDMEQILRKQLGSLERTRREPALALLGYSLFTLEAVDQIKPLVFDDNRMMQVLAIKALVCLDVPGANHLLETVVVCGALDDYEAASAIDALYISNDEHLEAIATGIVKSSPGPATFLSLLPILKRSRDYRQIIGEVFKTGAFPVPDRDQLTLAQHGNLNVEDALLNEIFLAPAAYMSDEAIKKRVLMYADTRSHFQLYTAALLILEKSGQELEYFTVRQKDTQLPAEKRRVLEKIIARIQKGARLK